MTTLKTTISALATLSIVMAVLALAAPATSQPLDWPGAGDFPCAGAVYRIKSGPPPSFDWDLSCAGYEPTCPNDTCEEWTTGSGSTACRCANTVQKNCCTVAFPGGQTTPTTEGYCTGSCGGGSCTLKYGVKVESGGWPIEYYIAKCE